MSPRRTPATPNDRTREQLLSELQELKARVIALEGCEARVEQLESTLRGGEAMSRRFLEQALFGVWVNVGGRVAFINRLGAEILGASDSREIVGKSVFDIIHPDYHDIVRDRIHIMNETRGPVPVIGEKLVGVDGHIVDVDLWAMHFLYEGQPAILVVFHDVTERRRAEKALVREKAILTKSQEVAHLGNWAWDLEAGEFTASAECYRIYGYEPGDVKPTREWLLSRILPEDRALMAYHMEARAKDGKQDNFDFRIMKPDGSITYVNTIVDKSVRDKTGKVTRLYGINQDVTERKRAEEALKFTQFALDNFTDSAIWITKDGRIVYVNQAACKGLGYSREELLSMHIWDVDPDYFPEKFQELWPEKRRGGYTKFESKHVARDGRAFPVEVTSSYMKYGDKEYLITFDRDITERKRIEREFRLTQFSVEKASDEIFWMESNGRAAYVNDAACRVLGYSREELLSMYVWDWDPVFSPDVWREYFNGLRENGFENFETLHRTRDGRVFPVEITANYVEYDDKEYSFAFVRDITERKKAEDALKESRRSLEKSQQVAHVGSWELDVETGKIERSAESFSIFGLPPSEGKVDYDDFLCAIVPEDRERVDKIIKSSQRTGEPYTTTYKIMRRDGEYRILLSKGEAIKDASGRVVRMFSINQDVTEMKQAEREANEARMQAELYLDLMGHDIRNMNQIGMGYLELALDSPDINRNDKELLLKSMGALKNSTHLIENVRKMQKARIGEFKLHEMDACQTIQRVISHYSNMPGVKATLNNDLPLACPVMANDLLYEVFENLVGNAIKHAGPEPTITIKFGTTLFNGNDYYRFIVEDNGPGIPDDRKEKIFNRLHKGSARGMGLGLYLVKSLVESYHGKVWVEDRVKGDHTKGARFVVMLPAVEK